MGYRRSFTKRIAVHYSGSVSYPASQNGGSVPYSGTAYEDVTVNVNVATEPFDHSIARCNTHVGTLTGAVVATEAAQVASIRENARKVGQTIIDGFFKTVRSEISQQISELTSRINATLVHLHELARRCVDKQQQMESDYNRISARYRKIFEELNGELKNRIYELDRPTFNFRAESDRNASRFIEGREVSSTLVAGKEESSLQALIAASRSKKQARDTIQEIDRFLTGQKRLERLLQHCILDENEASSIYVPVCWVETTAERGVIDRHFYQPDHVPEIPQPQFEDALSGAEWSEMAPSSAEHIQRFFNREVSEHYASTDPHANRVKECITRMFNISTIKSL